MRTFISISILLLVLVGCTNRRSGEAVKYTLPEQSLLVVDHPAVVVFNRSVTPLSGKAEGQQASIEKILTPFHIPLIASKTRGIEFVKNNGERVKLNFNHLNPRYDLILFNAVNDPVPCFLKDLGQAAKDYFSQSFSFPEKKQKPDYGLIILSLNPDTSRQTPAAKTFHTSTGKYKTLVIPIADTATLPLPAKDIPGIRWVESRVDTRSFLNVTFENDLITYANTDRYFTNGITFSLQAPWLCRIRLSGLMLPYRHSSNTSFSMLLVQNMYTPTDTRVAPALHHDRPYASYLYLGYQKITKDPIRKIKLTNEVLLGYMGPYSPGSYLQTLVHSSFPTNDKPMGWETQIKTDVILNYNLKIEKALIDNRHLMVSVSGSAKAGSLYSQAGAGFRVQAGKQEPYLSQKSLPGHSPWQYYFFLKMEGNFVGYDATLQGGLFKRDNIFSLKSNEISHWVGNAEGGIQVRYKGTGIELAQDYLSPEYKGGMWHKWGRISLILKL